MQGPDDRARVLRLVTECVNLQSRRDEVQDVGDFLRQLETGKDTQDSIDTRALVGRVVWAGKLAVEEAAYPVGCIHFVDLPSQCVQVALASKVSPFQQILKDVPFTAACDDKDFRQVTYGDLQGETCPGLSAQQHTPKSLSLVLLRVVGHFHLDVLPVWALELQHEWLHQRTKTPLLRGVTRKDAGKASAPRAKAPPKPKSGADQPDAPAKSRQTAPTKRAAPASSEGNARTDAPSVPAAAGTNGSVERPSSKKRSRAATPAAGSGKAAPDAAAAAPKKAAPAKKQPPKPQPRKNGTTARRGADAAADDDAGGSSARPEGLSPEAPADQRGGDDAGLVDSDDDTPPPTVVRTKKLSRALDDDDSEATEDDMPLSARLKALKSRPPSNGARKAVADRAAADAPPLKRSGSIGAAAAAAGVSGAGAEKRRAKAPGASISNGGSAASARAAAGPAPSGPRMFKQPAVQTAKIRKMLKEKKPTPQQKHEITKRSFLGLTASGSASKPKQRRPNSALAVNPLATARMDVQGVYDPVAALAPVALGKRSSLPDANELNSVKRPKPSQNGQSPQPGRPPLPIGRTNSTATNPLKINAQQAIERRSLSKELPDAAETHARPAGSNGFARPPDSAFDGDLPADRAPLDDADDHYDDRELLAPDEDFDRAYGRMDDDAGPDWGRNRVDVKAPPGRRELPPADAHRVNGRTEREHGVPAPARGRQNEWGGAMNGAGAARAAEPPLRDVVRPQLVGQWGELLEEPLEEAAGSGGVANGGQEGDRREAAPPPERGGRGSADPGGARFPRHDETPAWGGASQRAADEGGGFRGANGGVMHETAPRGQAAPHAAAAHGGRSFPGGQPATSPPGAASHPRQSPIQPRAPDFVGDRGEGLLHAAHAAGGGGGRVLPPIGSPHLPSGPHAAPHAAFVAPTLRPATYTTFAAAPPGAQPSSDSAARGLSAAASMPPFAAAGNFSSPPATMAAAGQTETVLASDVAAGVSASAGRTNWLPGPAFGGFPGPPPMQSSEPQAGARARPIYPQIANEHVFSREHPGRYEARDDPPPPDLPLSPYSPPPFDEGRAPRDYPHSFGSNPPLPISERLRKHRLESSAFRITPADAAARPDLFRDFSRSHADDRFWGVTPTTGGEWEFTICSQTGEGSRWSGAPEATGEQVMANLLVDLAMPPDAAEAADYDLARRPAVNARAAAAAGGGLPPPPDRRGGPAFEPADDMYRPPPPRHADAPFAWPNAQWPHRDEPATPAAFRGAFPAPTGGAAPADGRPGAAPPAERSPHGGRRSYHPAQGRGAAPGPSDRGGEFESRRAAPPRTPRADTRPRESDRHADRRADHTGQPRDGDDRRRGSERRELRGREPPASESGSQSERSRRSGSHDLREDHRRPHERSADRRPLDGRQTDLRRDRSRADAPLPRPDDGHGTRVSSASREIAPREPSDDDDDVLGRWGCS